MKKVFVLGGTGFLGYYTVEELLKHDIAVKTMSLPPKEDVGTINEDNPLDGMDHVEVLVGDMNAMEDDAIVELLSDCDGFVYAAGADERVQAKAPAKAFYYHANVLPTQRMVRLAGEAGVKHFVIFGSYFSEMAERYPELNIQDSPYINTRLLQEQVGFAEGEGVMDVTVIRLPYIFGTMENRMPLWKMFVDRIRDNEVYTVFKGGTACVTARQVGQAAVGALLYGKHRETFAIGDVNMTYERFATIIKEEINANTDIKVLTLEEALPVYKGMDKQLLEEQDREYGISMDTIAHVQQEFCYLNYRDTFPRLHVEREDIEEVLRDTIRYIVKLEKEQ